MQSLFNTSLLFAVTYGAYAEYDNTNNGADWTGTCATGKEQSPIDLPTSGATSRSDIFLILGDYGVSTNVADAADFANTIAIPDQNGMMTVADPDGDNLPPYTPLQFHFHYPSEHSVDGELMDAEMHIVHQNVEGNLAVLGVFFDLGDENEFLTSVLDD